MVTTTTSPLCDLAKRRFPFPPVHRRRAATARGSGNRQGRGLWGSRRQKKISGQQIPGLKSESSGHRCCAGSVSITPRHSTSIHTASISTMPIFVVNSILPTRKSPFPYGSDIVISQQDWVLNSLGCVPELVG